MIRFQIDRVQSLVHAASVIMPSLVIGCLPGTTAESGISVGILVGYRHGWTIDLIDVHAVRPSPKQLGVCLQFVAVEMEIFTPANPRWPA